MIIRLAVLYIVLMLGVFYGILVGKFEYPPYKLLGSIKREVPWLLNDMQNKPGRFTIADTSATLLGADELATHVIDGSTLYYKTTASAPRALFLQGAFQIGETLDHFTVLLDENGEIQQSWLLDENVDGNPGQQFSNKYPHGFEYFNDGSIVYSFDKGISLTKKDYCGNVLWSTPGEYHHSISKASEDVIVALHQFSYDPTPYEDEIHLIDANTGEIIKRFSLGEIMDANPNIDPLGLRQNDNGNGSTWAGDPHHMNDADALTVEMAPYHPDFAVGDLLVSLRSINLVFAVSPETLEIKWFAQGMTRRQHDPDWSPFGISVFDNNMHRTHSHISTLHTDGRMPTITANGADYDFYTWRRGKHQWAQNGDLLITSPEQGRVFGIDQSGATYLEVLNLPDGDFGTRYAFSEAAFVAPEAAQAWSQKSCP